MSITAINSQYSSSTQATSAATSSVSADGASSSATASSSSSTTTASSTTVSSDLGSWLTSMGIGDDAAVQLMAALLTLAILQELLGEEDEDSDSAGLLASLGQGSSFFFSSSSYSSSTTISSTSYSGQAADAGGELDVTAGADTTVADSGGTTEPAPTEGPVLDIVA